MPLVLGLTLQVRQSLAAITELAMHFHHEGHVPKLDQVANKRLALPFDAAVTQNAPGGVPKLRFGCLDQVGR
jgi:hypothetical protein